MLVLDTNVVLDLFHFDDVAVRPLRIALGCGQVRCTVTPVTLKELKRVLAYPEFALDTVRQEALLTSYQGLSNLAAVGDAGVELPCCSDPDDQKFLELAATANAQGLVSKDRALLKLRRRCAPLFKIMTPVEAVHWLEALPD